MQKKWLIWFVLGVVGIASLLRLSKRGRIIGAKLTAISRGAPPYASITWQWTKGRRPAHVTIDVSSGNGVSGNIRVGSNALFADVPLSGELEGAYAVTSTAAYRLLGIPSAVIHTEIGHLESVAG